MDLMEICLSEPLPEDHDLPALIQKFEDIYKTPNGYITHPVLETALRKINKQALSNSALVLSVSECEVLRRINRAQAWDYGHQTHYRVRKPHPVRSDEHQHHFAAGREACYRNPRHTFYAVKFGDHQKDTSELWGQRIWPEKRLPFLKEALKEAECRKLKGEVAEGKRIMQEVAKTRKEAESKKLKRELAEGKRIMREVREARKTSKAEASDDAGIPG